MTRYFTVRGSGNFPLLLLHVAKCYPATPIDAERLSYAMPTQAKTQTITLATESYGSISSTLWKAANWPITSTW